MLSNDDLQRLTRLVNLREYMSNEQLEKLLEVIKAMKADGGGVMPASAMQDLISCVDDRLMASIVADNRGGVSQPGFIKREGGQPVTRGSGWQKPRDPVRSVAQTDAFDAMVDFWAGPVNRVK